MSLLKKATMLGASGTASSASSGVYVEDVFSTYLYDGQSNTATKINNGINLSEEGGMVWVKCRSNPVSHHLYDTERGVAARLQSDSTNGGASTPQLGSFDLDGFTHSATPTNQNLDINETGRTFASWTFRKAPKFFDVVTYTGDGSAGRQISHNLNATVGTLIIRRTDGGQNWLVWHRALANNQWLVLNSSYGLPTTGVTGELNNTKPSTSVFTVGSGAVTNASGGTYVAYLFAHNDGDGEFGENGDQDIIKCGSYAGYGTATGPVVNLGWEPQWLLIKEVSADGNAWSLYDTMRNGTMDQHLRPNASDAEAIASTSPEILPLATGFKLNTNSGRINRTETYIYIAIRRPMKTPTSGSEVFTPVARTVSSSTLVNVGHVVDLNIQKLRTSSDPAIFQDRLRGVPLGLASSSTGVENAGYNTISSLTTNIGFVEGSYTNGQSVVYQNFKRAPGFFDVVCYRGDAATSRDVNHNLGVVPEFVIVKSRNGANSWFVYHKDRPTYALALNESGAPNYGGFPGTMTSTTFSVGGTNTNSGNSSYWDYIAYLFATLDGISKVGSYTGNGTSQNINCGFSTGARFVLIKRTDATGDWHVWDTARGIVTGNDPFLELNTTDAENSSYDSVDPYSAGFSVNQDAGTNINVSSGTYIFLAIS